MDSIVLARRDFIGKHVREHVGSALECARKPGVPPVYALTLQLLACTLDEDFELSDSWISSRPTATSADGNAEPKRFRPLSRRCVAVPQPVTRFARIRALAGRSAGHAPGRWEVRCLRESQMPGSHSRGGISRVAGLGEQLERATYVTLNASGSLVILPTEITAARLLTSATEALESLHDLPVVLAVRRVARAASRTTLPWLRVRGLGTLAMHEHQARRASCGHFGGSLRSRPSRLAGQPLFCDSIPRRNIRHRRGSSSRPPACCSHI